MKSRTRFGAGFALALLLTLPSPVSTALAQGSLTPPGAPGATMKSLAQIEPRTPISSLPFTITNAGSYYLTTNLAGVSNADGITISSGDVTLDLGGFALTGVPGSLNGINLTGAYTNVTVRNGTVRGWGRSGVEAFLGYNETLEHLVVSDVSGRYGIDAYGAVVRDCAAESCGTNAGIYVDNGVVRDCTVNHTLSAGGSSYSAGISVFSSQVSGCTVNNSGRAGIDAEGGSQVRDCVVFNSYSDGIDAYDSDVRDCVVETNGTGIYVAPGTVSGCHVENNVFSGIYANAPGCRIADNACLKNNLQSSTSDAGIYLNAGNNRVANNHVTGSGNAGIQVNGNGGAFTNNVIVKNTVMGNGAKDYVIPGAQIVGPFITTTGLITNSNPWANFSF